MRAKRKSRKGISIAIAALILAPIIFAKKYPSDQEAELVTAMENFRQAKEFQEMRDVTLEVTRFRERIAKTGLAASEIKSYETACDEMLRRGHHAEAIAILAIIRGECDKGTGWYKDIAALNDELAKAHLTLADIGTSAEELDKLKAHGHIGAARNWLTKARTEDPRFTAENVAYVRSEIRKAQSTFAKIRTSENELLALERNAALALAKRKPVEMTKISSR